ncbi:UNVERIFIED_ORG: hypothetical protein J2W19_002682 [Shinella zoogloeoides]|nr:hypothetical protein [Shinella zoogloeoides]
MAYEHKSGLPYAYDRAAGRPEVKSVVFHGLRPLIQGAELIEMQTIERGARTRLGNIVVSEGQRIERGSAFVNIDAGTMTIEAGRVYAEGDDWAVPARVLTGVPMVGRVEVGIRIVTSYVTDEDDASLKGLVPGEISEGEAGAAREVAFAKWAHKGDGEDGTFYTVYLLQDGVILDQEGPNILAPAMQAIAIYDQPNGSYIVEGCRVTWLATDAGKQIFSISEGEANINGYKRTRLVALRHEQPEEWDTLPVPGETHTYTGGATCTFEVDFAPIDSIQQIMLTKRTTVNVTRGAIANGQDGLGQTGVIAIESIPGYNQNVDYTRTGNTVNWGLAGAEPSPGTTYAVTILYRDDVLPVTTTDRTITVAGGAEGFDIITNYTSKQPRIDRLCLGEDGAPVYIKGISARANAMPPAVPKNVLPLCQVHNDWLGPPRIVIDGKNDGVIFNPQADLARVKFALMDLQRLVGLERIQQSIDNREPVAKKGIFVDPFIDDTYRDEGIAQTAAIFDGVLQLAIDPSFHTATLDAPVMLDAVEEVILSQPLKSLCEKINPYANFTFLPGALALQPAADFWTVSRDQWLSAQTQEFNRGTRIDGGPLRTSSTTTQLVDTRTELIEFLRQIPVAFTITGFPPGEILDELLFDGVDVTPAGNPAADAHGKLTGSFVIPANVTAGSKIVTAKGRAGTEATTAFAGQGTIETRLLRQITTVETWTAARLRGRGIRDTNSSTQSGPDPQAQIFAVPELRQVMGVDFHVCAIGDVNNHLVVNQVTTDNGYPTANIQAEAIVSMLDATVGWMSARYTLPVTTDPQSYHAFVIKTDDAEHSISIAKLGGFDADLQQKITKHPFTMGPRFSSVNAQTWTAHQDEALTQRVIAATYPVTTKVVPLGSFDLEHCSDLQVRAAVELPSAGCSVEFEIERTNGTIYRLAPFQVLQLTEYITETVQLRAVLKGTSKLSPILFAPVELVEGSIHQEGTYVTRAFALGEAVRLANYFKAFLPGGSAVDVKISSDGGAWANLPLVSTEALAFPLWTERKHELTNQTGTMVRLKVTVTGGPASRPLLGDFSAAIL